MARYENGALLRPVWLVRQTGIRLASGFSRGFYGQHNVSIILQTPLTGNAAWRGEDLAGDTSWIHHLSADSIRALDAALALAAAAAPEEIMLIGGAELYRQALPQADVLYLTEIDAEFAGDAFFPEVDLARWRIDREEAGQRDSDGLRWRFVRYLPRG